MMLTLRKKLEEIRNGTKVTSIRITTPTRAKHYNKWVVSDKTELAHLWWLNPRNQHPDCHKIGSPLLKDTRKKLGGTLDNTDAILDGFQGIKELRTVLMELNNIDREFILDHNIWYIYEWEKL